MDFDIGDCPMSFFKKKSFFLKTVFIHGKCMCEGVGENSRHGGKACRHSSRNVHIFTSMCVFAIAFALRWGVALVGEFLYWALLTSSWENIFRCWRYTRRWNSSDILVVKKAKLGFVM